MKRLTVLWTLKPAGTCVSAVPILTSSSSGDAGVAAARTVGVGALHVLPLAVEPVGLVGAEILAGLELGLELGAPVGLELVDLVGGQQAFADQPLGIEFQRRLVARGCLEYISGWVKLGSSPSLWPKRR